MTSRALRVLLAGEGGPAGAGVRRLLKSVPGLHFVGEARDDDHTLALVRRHRPHAVVVDASVVTSPRFETTLRLAREWPDGRVLVLAEQADDEFVRQALCAGAMGYLSGFVTAEELIHAVRAVLRGGIYLDAQVCKAFVTACLDCGHRTPAATLPLTPRQREVLRFIAEGMSTKKIAATLKVSIKTVETHRAHLMQRLGIYEVAGLVRYALRHGLIQPDS